MIRSLASISLLLALLPSLALAQFGFFDGMFGQQRQQQQQQQQRGGVSQWAAVADSIPCSQYLCPGTLECVAQPILCPCPYAEDYKCIIPELDKDGKPEKMGGAAVVCVRGKEGCEQVMKLL